MEDNSTEEVTDQYGGGIFYMNSMVTLVETMDLFKKNAAYGGAIYHCQSCTMQIENTTYEENYCFYGCIILATEKGPSISITSAVISNNLAGQQAVLASIAGDGYSSSLKIESSTITNNNVYYGKVALIYIAQSLMDLSLVDDEISDNLIYYPNMDDGVAAGVLFIT